MPKVLRSIRARLLVLLLSLLSVALGLISHKIYSDASHEVEELFDAQLAQTSRVLMGLVRMSCRPTRAATCRLRWMKPCC